MASEGVSADWFFVLTFAELENARSIKYVEKY